MPGTVLGSVDHLIAFGPTGSNQEAFTSLFKFLNGPLRSSSYVELVALQTGSAQTGVPASQMGTNYHDKINPFGENAFACFRWRSGSTPFGGPSTRRAHDYYMLLQWSYNTTFGNAPGNPGRCYGGTFGVGISIAWREDGGNPWGGTTMANGNDSKGSTVWVSGASVVHSFPRSNNPGGTHNTLKENTVGYPTSVAVTSRIHYVADRDSLMMVGDDGDNQSYNFMLYVGTYEPLSSSQFVTSSGGNMSMPMVMMTHNTVIAFAPSTTYGGTAGTDSNNGGIIGPVTASGQVRNVRMDRYSTNLLANTSLQPNSQFNPNAFDEFKIPVMLFEAGAFGHVGYLDMITEVFNVSVHSTNADFTKAAFSAGGGNVGFVIPWSGSAPGSTSTQAGRQWSLV